jgi:signal transduction histidine kinase
VGQMSQWSIRVIIGIVGVLWGLGVEALYYGAGTPADEVLLDLAIGWTYLFGGLALWASRPANRTGRLMTLVGLAWFIGNLGVSDVRGLHELGVLFGGVAAAVLITLILAYPTGRLETRLDRVTVSVVAIGWFATGAAQLLAASVGTDLGLGLPAVNGALAAFAGVVIIRRWLEAPPRRRPELLPVLIAGSIEIAVLVIFVAAQFVTVPEEEAILLAAKNLAPAAIPLALLIGIYRQSELRQRALLGAMPDLMIRLTTDGHYLDVEANDSALLRGSPDRTVAGRISDILPAHAAQAVLSAASQAIESGQLQTVDVSLDSPIGRRDFETRITPSGADEVTAIVRDFTDRRAAEAELRQSRTRIVEATDAERRRLERDLHDGAQQRLVSLSLALRLARSKLDGEVSLDAAAAGLDDAADELKTAITELRELARGIHPAILTEAGLGPAIDSLAHRSTVTAAVLALPDRRLSPAVEATAYFVVSEALTNVAKYASATTATVAAQCPANSLHVEVTDDGVGGADPTRGSGLRGLADRVAALGGSLSIISPTGGGTRVIAEIPLG